VQQAGMQVVAVCERDTRRRQEAATTLDVTGYQDVEPFLDHAVDAVILVNDFDQHAPVAIGALERDLNVLSETAACRTLAEGVALIDAAEHASGVYMFAENYPYLPFTQEMRRRHQAGDIGEIRYAEAEYLDDPADLAAMANDRAHWRAHTPATSHSTHSLAPVAAITGTRPVVEWYPTRTCTSGSSCRSPGSRRCGPAWPGAFPSRFPTRAAPTSAHPTRPIPGSRNCPSYDPDSLRRIIPPHTWASHPASKGAPPRLAAKLLG
jgi:predicted dehydrogenase